MSFTISHAESMREKSERVKPFQISLHFYSVELTQMISHYGLDLNGGDVCTENSSAWKYKGYTVDFAMGFEVINIGIKSKVIQNYYANYFRFALERHSTMNWNGSKKEEKVRVSKQ